MADSEKTECSPQKGVAAKERSEMTMEKKHEKPMIVSMKMIELEHIDLFSEDFRLLKRFSKYWTKYMMALLKRINKSEETADKLVWKQPLVACKNDSQRIIENHKKKMNRDFAERLRAQANIGREELAIAKEINKLDRVLCVMERELVLGNAEQKECWIFWYQDKPVVFDKKKLTEGFPDEFSESDRENAKKLLYKQVGE